MGFNEQELGVASSFFAISVVDFCLRCKLMLSYQQKYKRYIFVADLGSGEQEEEERVSGALGEKVLT